MTTATVDELVFFIFSNHVEDQTEDDVYAMRAPKKKSPPYIVFRNRGSETETLLNGRSIGITTTFFQIYVWDKSSTRATKTASKIKTGFRKAPKLVNGLKVFSYRIDDSDSELDPEQEDFLTVLDLTIRHKDTH